MKICGRHTKPMLRLGVERLTFRAKGAAAASWHVHAKCAHTTAAVIESAQSTFNQGLVAKRHSQDVHKPYHGPPQVPVAQRLALLLACRAGAKGEHHQLQVQIYLLQIP